MSSVSFLSVQNFLKLPKVPLSSEGNENNKLGYPYKLARLVSSKRPYVVFYVWNENENKLFRIRRDVPKDIDSKKWISEKIKHINELLVLGYRIRKQQNEELNRSPETYTIIEALKIAQKVRANELQKTTITRDRSFFNTLIEFLESERLEKLSIIEIEKKHLNLFLDNLKKKRELSNLSRNNYLRWLKAVFSIFVQRDLIKENPCKSIKNLKEQETKSTAFPVEHLKELVQLCKNESEELYIFCMFVFYTFIRPIELRRLNVSQIDLQSKKIQIYGNQSKNKKTEFVMIPKPLEKILVDSGFLNRDVNSYLFSDYKDLQYSRNKFSTLFGKICKENGYPKEYSLYCFKHTGVVEFYKKGCGIKFIQMQCRHSSLDMTNKYLKSLGLFENEEILNNAPEID